MEPRTISYRAGLARRVGGLEGIGGLDDFAAGQAAIHPVAIMRPGDPDRVGT
jgi:hypothetical protein